ncbi:MAG TPA: phage portal protein, partial [Alphaproteobacteria bacterium]|nr:phage portal protein [Alphaproteobacteria bacterium]
MKNPFSSLFKARDKPQNSVSSALAFFFSTSAAGKPVSPRTAVQMTAVYACVRVIAET